MSIPLQLDELRAWFERRVLKRSWMLKEYARPSMHEIMLGDKARCDAFREAIFRTVKPGDVVVDLGAGTGLLSFFALQAGARHVYAIEMSKIADVTAELIAANQFSDHVTLIRKSSTKAHLPERCDVLVSETLSTFAFDTDNTIEFVADAGERFLKPNARIIPESADTFLLPFSSDVFGAGRFTPANAGHPPLFYGLDYQPLTKRLYKETRLVRASDNPFVALGDPVRCYHIDFRKDSPNPSKTFVPFRITTGGRLDGFLGWFEARLCEGVTLSNSPYLPLTHWWQIYFPVPEQPHYRAGETLLFCLDPNFTNGEAQWKYAVQSATKDSS